MKALGHYYRAAARSSFPTRIRWDNYTKIFANYRDDAGGDQTA